MEERQHGQHMIVGVKAVHVLAHHAVPQQRLLPEHGAFRPAGRARGVDQQQRARRIDMRVAAVAAPTVEQGGKRHVGRGLVVEADDREIGQGLPQRRGHRAECGFQHQHLGGGIRQDEHLLGDGEPPVKRHQHRTEARARVKQHQIVGMIGRKDRHAVAAPDAEL